MERKLVVATVAGAQRNVKLIGYPDTCPRCRVRIVPASRLQAATLVSPHSRVDECFQCTNASCGSLFLAQYKWIRSAGELHEYNFERALPTDAVRPTQSKEIQALSPSFCEVFAQSVVSEVHSLNELTGIGLRKALEFLVKDFAIAENPNAKDAILSKTLSRCIDDYIADTSVKAIATRAAWLGNDETHYLRKWLDKDVDDLKILIKLTVNGIENVQLTKKYLSEMPSAGPAA